MGFRFRKSVNFGPLRVNFSKSGVGYSVGGKGFRATKKAGGGYRTTASIPGTGMSYVKDYPEHHTEEKSSGASKDNINKPKKPVRTIIGVLIILAMIGAVMSACNSESDQSKSAENSPMQTTAVSSPSQTEPTGPSQEDVETEIISMLSGLASAENIEVRTVTDTTEITVIIPDLAQAEHREQTKADLTECVQNLPLLPNTSQSVLYAIPAREAEITYTFGNGRLVYDAIAVQAEKEEENTSKSENVIMVYVSNSGSKYHRNSDCSGMQNPQQVPISQAQSMGLTACKRCY